MASRSHNLTKCVARSIYENNIKMVLLMRILKWATITGLLVYKWDKRCLLFLIFKPYLA